MTYLVKQNVKGREEASLVNLRSQLERESPFICP